MPEAIDTSPGFEHAMLNLKVDRKSGEPLYVQVKRQIADAIDSGCLTAGSRVPSVRAISAATGISCGTVAKAVAELKHESFLQGRGRSGLAVTAPRHLTIGVTGKFRQPFFFGDAYYQGIMSGVESVLSPRGYALTFRQSDGGVERTFAGFRIHGLLLFGLGLVNTLRAARSVTRLFLPTMAVGLSWYVPPPGVNCVLSDNEGDSSRVVERLLQAGRTKIAVIVHHATSSRLLGCRRALQAAGLRLDRRLVVVRDSNSHLDTDLKRAAGQRPDAVFDTIGDLWPRLMAEWPGAGTTRPAVATYRDAPLEWERLAAPHLIVRQPLRDMGKAATEKLLRLVERPESHAVRTVLPSEIVDCLTTRGNR